jgi:hypothetical protein
MCEVIKKRNYTLFYYAGLITMVKYLLTISPSTNDNLKKTDLFFL